MNIDQHILEVLGNRVGREDPMTIGDFARRFGISVQLVAPAARRLVDAGLAVPMMIEVNGVSRLQGLLAAQPATPAAV